jgi:hypothetical protein
VPETPDIKADLKRVARWAAAVGVVLGLVCPSLSPRYQAPCQVLRTVINACTGVPS